MHTSRPEPALDARRLALMHAGARTPVIENLDLQIAPGGIVALVGPSGVGKSSLLRTLAGLETPHRGQILVEGRPLVGIHPRVALAFQDPGLLPWLSAEKNVAFGLDFKRQPAITRTEATSRVEAALRSVALEHARSRLPAALSGGMAQRVALARCLARRPSVLLLDEPFGALDEITRADMQKLLLRIVADLGAAVLLITHDIDEALVVADRIVLLGGSPATLLESWTVDVARPRDDALEALAPLRIQILAALRRAIRRLEPAHA